MPRCPPSAGSGWAAGDALRGGGSTEGTRSPAAMRRMPVCLSHGAREAAGGGDAVPGGSGAGSGGSGGGSGAGPIPSHPIPAGRGARAPRCPRRQLAPAGAAAPSADRHYLFTAAANAGQGALPPPPTRGPSPALPSPPRGAAPGAAGPADRSPPRSPCRTCLFHIGL